MSRRSSFTRLASRAVFRFRTDAARFKANQFSTITNGKIDAALRFNQYLRIIGYEIGRRAHLFGRRRRAMNIYGVVVLSLRLLSTFPWPRHRTFNFHSSLRSSLT